MHKNFNSKAIQFTAIIFGCIVVLLYFIFCIYFLRHTREELLNDYILKGGCFYRQDKFSNINFTEAVKNTGNYLCLLAMSLIFLVAYFIRKFPARSIVLTIAKHIKSSRKSYPWLAALLLLCIALAVYGFIENALCTDEAFSALNFAQQPAVRLLSYYPLPNNHVFYNLINHFVYPFFNNSFISGRVISIVFYCMLVIGNFFLFLHFTKNNFISFLCSALLSLQFLVWGFGHQARGYSLCYLMEWGSLVSFYYYFFSNGSKKREAIFVLVFCNVIGMWTVPVFLYCLVFQGFSAIVLMIAQRKLHLEFWVAIAISCVGIFLCYLPVFCYSGFASIFGIGYNKDNSVAQILTQSAIYFYDLVSLQTFGFLEGFKQIASALFVVPFLAFFIFKRQIKSLDKLLFLYLMQWFSMLVMIIVMRQFPVMRGIGSQLQFSLIILLLMFCQLILNSGKIKNWAIGIFTFCSILACIRMFNYNKENSHYDLYGQDTKGFYKSLNALPKDFGDAEIWLSDESFMWPFILKDLNKVKNYDCNFNHQKIIFLSEDDKPLPKEIMEQYVEKNRAGWFIIYEHK